MGAKEYTMEICYCFLVTQNHNNNNNKINALFIWCLSKEKGAQFYWKPTSPFVRYPVIFLPQEPQIPISSLAILPYSLFTISAYFRVVVSIGTFYCADEQCWTARWNVWSTVIYLFFSASFKFSSGLLEMKLQDVKSYGGLILFLYLLSWWVTNVIEDVTHHTETQIMDVAKHNPLQIPKEHIQQSLGFKVSKYCCLKTWNFDPRTWRSNNPTVSSTDQELWPPSCPPILLKSKDQPKDGN